MMELRYSEQGNDTLIEYKTLRGYLEQYLEKIRHETLHIDEAASQIVKMRFSVSGRNNILYDRIKIFRTRE